MAEPTVAIALGAGGARGLAHVHALEALDDLGIKPAAMSGTSMGAIMGAGYASGLSAEEIQAYIRERFRNRVKLLADLWRTRPDTVRAFIAEANAPALAEMAARLREAVDRGLWAPRLNSAYDRLSALVGERKEAAE